MLFHLLLHAQEIGFTGIGFYQKENFLLGLGLEKKGFDNDFL